MLLKLIKVCELMGAPLSAHAVKAEGGIKPMALSPCPYDPITMQNGQVSSL